MPRVTSGPAKRRKTKRVLKKAKGYYGRRSKILTTARDAVERAEDNARFGRKQRKRDFRRLWITRISAAARERGVSYSRLMQGLKAANVQMNRKAMSDLAIADPKAFDALVEMAKSGIA